VGSYAGSCHQTPFLSYKSLDLGRGGISQLSALTGLSRTTTTKAVEELQSGKLVSPGEGRVRQVGGGKKKVEGVDPGIRDILEKILEETTAGDPMSVLRGPANRPARWQKS